MRGPPSYIFTRQRVNTREARESRRTRPSMSQEQYDSILEQVTRYGRQEFERQRKEIPDLTTGLTAQAKLQKHQQEAHKETYPAANVTYNELVKLRSEVEAEVAALKGQAEGQGAAVTTLTENIT